MTLANTHLINIAQRGEAFVLAQNVNLTVLNPLQPLEFNKQNLNSVAMRLQIGESTFLLMGDAEVETEESILQSGIEVNGDVLKVGHHGSNTATSDHFLTTVSPSIAIVSAGEDNPYGHPHQETLDKLIANQITTYGTYQSGTITITANSTSIQVQNDPTPIPEISISIIIGSLTITLSIVIILKRKT
jgi:beta-lactamase superfamily II metal-dependent hydrolase